MFSSHTYEYMKSNHGGLNPKYESILNFRNKEVNITLDGMVFKKLDTLYAYLRYLVQMNLNHKRSETPDSYDARHWNLLNTAKKTLSSGDRVWVEHNILALRYVFDDEYSDVIEYLLKHKLDIKSAKDPELSIATSSDLETLRASKTVVTKKSSLQLKRESQARSKLFLNPKSDAPVLRINAPEDAKILLHRVNNLDGKVIFRILGAHAIFVSIDDLSKHLSRTLGTGSFIVGPTDEKYKHLLRDEIRVNGDIRHEITNALVKLGVAPDNIR